MILIDGAKYLCLLCVRGHRLTACVHHEGRPLVKVKGKGRPAYDAQIELDQRVVVFSEQAEVDEDDANIVRVTHHLAKQVLDVNTNQIIGPYVENAKTFKPLVHANLFINTLCGCSITGKVKKLCGCSRQKVNKKRILEKYITRKQAAQPTLEFQAPILKQDAQFDMASADTSGTSLTPVTTHTPLQNSTNPLNLLPTNQPLEWIAVHPCLCDDSCQCPGCQVHNIPWQFPEPPQPQAEPQFDLPDPYSVITTPGSDILGPMSDSPTCCCPNDACDCTNCETHGIINGFKLDDILDMSFPQLLIDHILAQIPLPGFAPERLCLLLGLVPTLSPAPSELSPAPTKLKSCCHSR